jgi:uncharacterized protein
MACDSRVLTDQCAAHAGAVFEQGDHWLAAALLNRACRIWAEGMQFPAACNNLGVLYESGTGVPQSDAQAIRLFAAACRGEDAWGCWNQARFIEAGRGVAKDPDRALQLYRSACTAGHPLACERAKAAGQGTN